MGLPMAKLLNAEVFDTIGFDLSPKASAEFKASGGKIANNPRATMKGASIVITMLPDGAIVRSVLEDVDNGQALPDSGALVIDMSSSEPIGTQELHARFSKSGIGMIDAPVSGGVSRAQTGTLSIMVGGDEENIRRAAPILSTFGTIKRTGKIGSGHAAKCLNNYVSAAGLFAACQALIAGQEYGLDPAAMIEILNSSTGQNFATSNKLQQQILSSRFESGFAMSLMAKDLKTASNLADALGLKNIHMSSDAKIWAEASQSLGPLSDHTEIYRFLQKRKMHES